MWKHTFSLGSNLQEHGSDQQWDWQHQWATHQAEAGAREAQGGGGDPEQVQHGQSGEDRGGY